MIDEMGWYCLHSCTREAAAALHHTRFRLARK
jgi:hypothetical protein